MRLTRHADEHILDRTRMRAEDVLALVTHEATVLLGTTRKGYSFQLFWSPQEGEAKIAITSNGALVSVWEETFTLPPGIRPVTEANKRRARKALKKFILSRSPTPQLSMFLDASLDVYLKGKSVHTESIGKLSPEAAQLYTETLKIAPARSQIERIVATVESVVPSTEDSSYSLFTHDTLKKEVRRKWVIPHRTLITTLRTA